MPPKKHIIIFGVLCVISLGLGYWSGMPEKDSGQRAEVIAPTIITNIVTNVLKEVVTNTVASTPQLTPIPENLDELNPIIEEAIRKQVDKPTGELTRADLKNLQYLALNGAQLTDVRGLEQLTQLKSLNLAINKLTSVKGLEQLTQLEKLLLAHNKLTSLKGLEQLPQLKELELENNPALTKAQIDQLQKALPKCKIESNPTK